MCINFRHKFTSEIFRGRGLFSIYEKLMELYGPQNWWPIDLDYHIKYGTDPREEIVIGAVLTQNTSWKNVEKALENLKHKKLLNFKGILSISREELEEIIRPVGFYRIKAKRLKEVVKGLNPIKKVEVIEREELLKIKGVGRETADSILLYAGNRPFFVIDAYTKRFFKRIVGIEGDYEYLKSMFEESLPRDVNIYKEYHALIVKHGKEHCTKNPKCANCPFREECQYFLSSG